MTCGELNLDKSSFQVNYKKVTLFKEDGFGVQEIGLHKYLTLFLSGSSQFLPWATVWPAYILPQV